MKRWPERGVTGTRAVSRPIWRLIDNAESKLRQFLNLLRGISDLRAANFRVQFPAEGSAQIHLPQIGFGSMVTTKGRLLAQQSVTFSRRPGKEPLLRHIAFMLYEEGLIARTGSIVDIGAWIGANTLAWALMLEDPGVVVAIDPSSENLTFINLLAVENAIGNICLVPAVCSDLQGQTLFYSGDLSHTEFSADSNGDSSTRATTIDEVLYGLNLLSVGLMHIDVEGFELRVLRGASDTIRTARPVVIFEHHIKDHSMLQDLIDWFHELDYQVLMINEVLPGCREDCRNFLSVPSERWEHIASKLEMRRFAGSSHFPAVPGQWLTPV